MKPRSWAWRFASSMFGDSSSVVTLGCVSVCTKSVFVMTGGATVVVVGTGGTVIDTVSVGCTVGFTGVVLCRHAGAAIAAIRTPPQRRLFHALVLAFSTPYR